MTDDAELLRRYARERTETAFTELVQRHAGLVYSAALRQVGGNSALAQEVSQSVFTDLARKAASLCSRPVLASWLYTSTRFAALKALRGQQRRQRREQEAQAMHDIEQGELSIADWERVRPLIDQAVCGLPEEDRAVILMRYFENQPFAVIGTRLGIAENSARMRTERALEKLRVVLRDQGVASTGAALSYSLVTHAVSAPPLELVTAIAGTALAKAVAVGSATSLAAKLTPIFAMNKLKMGVIAALTVGAAGLASYEVADERARSTALLVYTGCFGVGLLFAVLSLVFGHFGHSHFETDQHIGGHAEAGFGTNDMPGFEPIGPTTIATFVTAFGGLGMILIRHDSLHRFSGFLSAVGALAIAAVVAWGFTMAFQWAQGSSEGRIFEVMGLDATVITPIDASGVGEIAYVQSGTRYSAPARSDAGIAIPKGATVRITRVVGTQFFVAAS
jgi:RNA polymerase sigma factor (sigma-70 family)